MSDRPAIDDVRAAADIRGLDVTLVGGPKLYASEVQTRTLAALLRIELLLSEIRDRLPAPTQEPAPPRKRGV